MSDSETIDVYNTHAAEYAKKFTRPKPGRLLRQFIAAVPEKGHVLDLGCGTGSDAEHMMEAGLTVDGIDASKEMVAMATARGVTAKVALFDDVTGTDLYDGIWASFSLLHAPRDALPRHLAALHDALRPNGVFAIGMKLGTDTVRDRLGRKYTFVEASELEGLLEGAGFTITGQETGEEAGLAGTIDPWITVYAHA